VSGGLAEFGGRVREVRERQGLSQEAAAARAGLHRTYWGGVERGKRNATLRTIFRIADALAIPGHYLVGSGEAGDGAYSPAGSSSSAIGTCSAACTEQR
jgi:transcriptional regulator with XRE-family HTH domain